MNIRPAPLARFAPLTLALVLAVSAPAAQAAARPAPASKASPAPLLSVDPPEVVATAELTWSLDLHLLNNLDRGVYLDSMTCRIDDTDPGETRAERFRVTQVPIASTLPSVSSADSGDFVYTLPAVVESGRLLFTLHGHFADMKTFVAVAHATVAPGPVSKDHPSEFLTVDGHKVEYVVFKSQRDGPSPGMLLVHGHGSNARSMMGMATQLAARDYTVILASMPGYGLSEGPADFCGPRTLAAIGAVLDHLKAIPGVDSTRLGAWGVSRGAGVVANLATRRKDLKAVVAQSGIYDFWAGYRGTRIPGIQESMLAEAGKDSAGWGERSPILRAASVHAAMLVLHGEADANVPVEQAKAFVAALQAAGVTVESHFIPNAQHMLPRGEVNRAALAFLEAKLQK